jgi:ribosomal protein S18 acetylase RimI-like enzyme
METIIGFVVGFVVGTREGRAGMARLRSSVQAIRTSPETRKLAHQASAVAEAVARQAARRGLAGTVGEAVDLLIRRAGRGDSARPATRVA